MSFRGRGAIEIVERAYALETTDGQWLRGLADAAAAALGTHLPVEATLYCPRPGKPFGASTRVFTTEDPDFGATWVKLYEATTAVAPDDQLVAERLQNRCHTGSSWTRDNDLPMATMRQVFSELRERYGVADVLHIQGVDPSGESVLLSIALAEETLLHPRAQRALERVAVHLAAGLRLRNALKGAAVALTDGVAILAGAEAVLDASGKVVDASGQARSERARDHLRVAALAIDKARGRLARERPEEATALWQGLIGGRWSIIEVTDTDARRYWVARRNEPEVAEDRRLTRREGQVVGLVALGLSDDMVAYSLGLAEATIRTHLRRGMKKLGMSERSQIITLHAALIG